jgi:hypothetical protein
MNTSYKVTVDENGKYHIEMSADIFIVPNRYCKVSDYDYLTSRKNFFYEVGKLNNVTINEDTKLVETWVCSDLSDNFSDHYPHIKYDGKKISVRILSDMIPLEILKEKKEGDVFTYTYPITGDYEDEKIEGTVELLLTCNQYDYRYRRFGNFEDALAVAI